MEEDIGGLDVPVDDLPAEQLLEGTDQLFEIRNRVILVDHLLRLYLLLQSPPIAELINQIVVAIRLLHLYELYDVRMVYFGQNRHLIVR